MMSEKVTQYISSVYACIAVHTHEIDARLVGVYHIPHIRVLGT